jgi:hypothetical protein
MRALVPALITAVAFGCTPTSRVLKNRAEVTSTPARVAVEFSDVDRPAAAQVQRSIERAMPSLERWGKLKVPVTVRVLPSHDALEEAVSRPGYPWLKAWARYDEVLLQSPRTWSLLGARPADVDELVLHELTHCAMYQLSSDRLTWMRKDIPLWFREGMASFTAGQGYRWPDLEALARFYERFPSADPVEEPEGTFTEAPSESRCPLTRLFKDPPGTLYRVQSDVVYGAAHHAFAFLVRRYGEERVRQLLSAMAQGLTFPEAFETILELSPKAFAQDFKRYVRWRGFRPRAGPLARHP